MRNRSTRELETAIRDYLAVCEHPKAFVWTKTADQIRASVAGFCKRTSDSGHYAVKHGDISRNPAVHTLVARGRAPRVADRVAEKVDPSEVLTAEQARALIEASKAGLHRTFITTALLTGRRSGELLALHGRTSTSLGGSGPPKTDSSYRTLDLVPDLAEWKVRSRFTADTDLVFTNRTGGAPNLSYLQKGAVKAFAAAQVPPINLHGLRHTFASLLLLQPPRDAGGEAARPQGPQHHDHDLQPLVHRRRGQEPGGNGRPRACGPDRR
jgi:integrase